MLEYRQSCPTEHLYILCTLGEPQIPLDLRCVWTKKVNQDSKILLTLVFKL